MIVDPSVELVGQALRDVILHCIERGRTVIGFHDGQDRMAERNITGGQILAALASGALRTDQCVAGCWRYLVRKHDVEVCFTFDGDDEGTLLVIVTVMRKD